MSEDSLVIDEINEVFHEYFPHFTVIDTSFSQKYPTMLAMSTSFNGYPRQSPSYPRRLQYVPACILDSILIPDSL